MYPDWRYNIYCHYKEKIPVILSLYFNLPLSNKEGGKWYEPTKELLNRCHTSK